MGGRADGHSVFRPFAAGIHLKEDIYDATKLLSLLVEILREPKTVYAMDQFRPGDDELDFVSLKVADHVPAGPHGIAPAAEYAFSLKEFMDHPGALIELLGPAGCQGRSIV
jgi:hypothetical protein